MSHPPVVAIVKILSLHNKQRGMKSNVRVEADCSTAVWEGGTLSAVTMCARADLRSSSTIREWEGFGTEPTCRFGGVLYPAS